MINRKKTKIICTIGPSSITKKTLKQMHKAGMNAVRLNMSHGNFEQYFKIIKNVRAVCNVPIILDTQGPEVRSVNEKIIFKKGEKIKIGLSVNIFNKLKKGITVLINDGLDKAKICKVNKDNIILKMLNKGVFPPNRSLIFKNTDLKLPILTKKDLKGINFAIKNKIEFIALSFTQTKENILTVKKLLKNTEIKIIAKIENQKGVKNYNKILDNVYGIMVARGDLGVEINSEKVPLLQKQMVKRCNEEGKVAIVATQMMESMIKNKTPTRAETNDVANAIIDGTDTLMLSGETSIGAHPILVVKSMSKICLNTEKYWDFKPLKVKNKTIENNITYCAFKIAKNMNATIICLTRSGYTAKMISRFKPKNKIIAVTINENTTKKLMLSYGVTSIHYKNLREYNNGEVDDITKLCIKKKLIKKEENIVFVAGLFVKKTTNSIIAYKARDII